jgi:GNAT superfamily N-acetyltransferase
VLRPGTRTVVRGSRTLTRLAWMPVGCRSVIVPRTPAHLSACADLARITHRTDGYPIVLPDDINAFLAPAAQLAAWIARADGAVVGHVGLHRPTSAAVAHVLAAAGLEAAPIGVVSRLMVGPEGRGCGTGMALLDRATVDAHGRGCGRSSTW